MYVILSMLLSAPLFVESLKAEKATYETSDGVKIVADYYAPLAAPDRDKKAPVAILIHMYPLNRSSWSQLIPPLHDAGFAILAYDIRGRGESTEPLNKNLRDLYGRQSPALFTEAWRDAEGALKWLSKRPECDTSHVTVIGASVGASIAIDFARREPRVKTIVGLSPYTEVMGIKTADHIKEIAKRAIFLLSPAGTEFDRIKDLTLACNCPVKSEHFPGSAAQHGTNLLDEPTYGDQVVRSVVDFCKTALASKNASPKPEANKKP